MVKQAVFVKYLIQFINCIQVGLYLTKRTVPQYVDTMVLISYCRLNANSRRKGVLANIIRCTSVSAVINGKTTSIFASINEILKR